MNLHQPAAIERTDVRPPALIESHIPCSNALRPVGQNASECRAPLTPVRQIISELVVVSALGPMHFHVRKFLLHVAHHLRASHVAVPRYCVHVFLESRPRELIQGTAKQIIIMIERPDFRAARFEQWAERYHQPLLVLFRPRTRWHSPPLVSVDLVLSGHCAYSHALCRVRFHEFLKVSRIGGYILRPDVSAQHRVAVFHPSRRAPWRSV